MDTTTKTTLLHAATDAFLLADVSFEDHDNDFGGTDFFLVDGRVLRITPIDGEFDVGIEVHLFNNDRAWVVQRSATIYGITPAGIGFIVQGMIA